jgi:hypothetical protein
VGLLGSDVLVLNRSDYGPFRNREVPYLFFSTGENPRYHSPDDTADTLDYDTAAAVSQVIHRVVVQAAGASRVPRWTSAPDIPLAEAETIRDVMKRLVDRRESLGLGTAQLFLMNNTLRTLEGIIARGTMTAVERNAVIQAVRVVLLTIH